MRNREITRQNRHNFGTILTKHFMEPGIVIVLSCCLNKDCLDLPRENYSFKTASGIPVGRNVDPACVELKNQTIYLAGYPSPMWEGHYFLRSFLLPQFFPFYCRFIQILGASRYSFT
jgi:hypothetical protein